MNSLVADSAVIGIILSIMGYEFGLYLKKKFNYAILNPLLISIIFVMIFLVVFKVDYESYNLSAKYLSYLLTPATVCLAVPLYEQMQLLKDNFMAIIIGIISGVLTSMGSVLALSMLFNLSHEQYVTLLPKSITTAIGIGLSEELGGMVTITVAVIIITGILGNILAEYICKMFKIKSSIAKGIALGTSAHAIGTARAMEMGDVEGAMSSLSIAVSGLCTTLMVSVFANLL